MNDPIPSQNFQGFQKVFLKFLNIVKTCKICKKIYKIKIEGNFGEIKIKMNPYSGISWKFKKLENWNVGIKNSIRVQISSAFKLIMFIPSINSEKLQV